MKPLVTQMQAKALDLSGPHTLPIRCSCCRAGTNMTRHCIVPRSSVDPDSRRWIQTAASTYTLGCRFIRTSPCHAWFDHRGVRVLPILPSMVEALLYGVPYGAIDERSRPRSFPVFTGPQMEAQSNNLPAPARLVINTHDLQGTQIP